MDSMNFLKGARTLTKNEMKSISGGIQECCAYTTNWNNPGYTCLPMGGATEAQFMADGDGTNTGWWACNTPEIIEACGCDI